MWFYEKPLNAPGYLRTEGPTKQSVTIYLLTRTLGAGLHYSFSVPKENLFSLLDTSEVLYSWDTVGGECEGVCGEGVRRREVRCVKVDKRSDTTVVDDAYCDPGVRPAEVEACPLEPCRWATEQWTEVCVCLSVCVCVCTCVRRYGCEYTYTNTSIVYNLECVCSEPNYNKNRSVTLGGRGLPSRGRLHLNPRYLWQE